LLRHQYDQAPEEDLPVLALPVQQSVGDIRAIFCEYCDKLSIEWRQMNQFNISVARAESVARMDGFIGPKR
jgi:hypothetical protein